MRNFQMNVAVLPAAYTPSTRLLKSKETYFLVALVFKGQKGCREKGYYRGVVEIRTVVLF